MMNAAPVLVVEHVITADDPFGAPWPPDGFVSIVRRLDSGWTVWHRLYLTNPERLPPWRPRGHSQIDGASKD